MTRVGLLVLTAVFVSACAAPPRHEWVREGTTPHDRESALSQCQYQMQLNRIPAIQQPDLLRLCMQGKGFRLRQI